MSDSDFSKDDVFSKVVRAGRRTYFFDVKETKAGDYYLTITESKKFTNQDETYVYKKHKIYLYKEDFKEFKSAFEETTDFIIEKKGEGTIYGNPQDNDTDGSASDKVRGDDITFEDI